jgi:hypothetical protein
VSEAGSRQRAGRVRVLWFCTAMAWKASIDALKIGDNTELAQLLRDSIDSAPAVIWEPSSADMC